MNITIYDGEISNKKNSSNGTEYLEYNERQTKTRTGENIVDIRQIKPKMIASGDVRDLVKSYKLYASKRPMDFLRTMTLFRRWLYSHASIAVAFSDLIIMKMLIAGTQGP